MRKIIFIVLLCVSVSVTAGNPKKKAISPDLFGIFYEDLNYAADGGLYAEMLQNRSFEYSPSDLDLHTNKQNNWHFFTAWDFLKDGNAIGRLSLETIDPIHPNNPHYVTVNVNTVGSRGVGIANHGYHGLTLRKGEHYKFSMFTRLLNVEQMPAKVQLMADGKVLASRNICLESAVWKKDTLVLVPDADAQDATLEIRFQKKGKIAVDMVSLFPEKTFKGRENGLRADLAQTIADLNPAFMRFPGGCLAHGDGLANIYRWKNTIGPVEQRIEDYNIWNYHQTMGLGYHEYLQFCEDIGAKPVPIIAAGVSCQNSARTRGVGQEAVPMEDMDEYIQDILDLVEYCNGDISTTWGSKRAAAGHPEPFHLEYIGIGNEDVISEAFKERFTMIYKAIHEKYPELKVIGTSGPSHTGEDFEKGWEVAKELQIQLVDEHGYNWPDWFLDNLKRYDSYDRNGPKVYLGEYAARGNRLYNALCEAAYLTQLERNGDVVHMTSYAPLLAHVKHIQWRPDMIYFTDADVFPSINYHVQRLFSNNAGDWYWSDVIEGCETASCVEDKETGDVILKFVNVSDKELPVKADLRGIKRLSGKAIITTLTGDKDAENSKTEHLSTDIVPEVVNTKVKKQFSYTLPPYSLVMVRVR